MKIIKQFEDKETLLLIYHWVETKELNGDYLYWGLGNDGNIYCRCSRFSSNEWKIINNLGHSLSRCFSLKLMKRIVNNFGHLEVWI
jgi:hypothetical protein